MAKLITKFKYLKPNRAKSAGGYAKYIATREGVEKIDDSKRHALVTVGQNDLIKRILRDFPDAKEMLPHSKKKYEESPAVQRMQYNLDTEVGKIKPNEKYIISMVCDMASQMYKDSQAKNMIIAHIAQKRVELMKPQENFNCEYFSDLIDYITLSDKFRVTLHTKTDTAVGEGEMIDGSQENT